MFVTMADDSTSVISEASNAPTEPQTASNISRNANPAADSDSQWGAAYDGVDWKQILGYHVPKPASKRWSWFWAYGYDIQDSKDRSKHWLCKICHQKKWYRKHQFAESGTDNIKRHMREQHGFDENGEPSAKKPKQDFFQRVQLDATKPREQEILNTMITAFDPKLFKQLLIAWVVHDNIAFNKVQSPHLRRLFDCANPLISDSGSLPTHSTVSSWIVNEWKRQKGVITELLRAAPGKIHLSFDLWTSRNHKALMGKPHPQARYLRLIKR